MNYKFVDIGTCFYATSIDDFGTDVNTIYIEPIKEFLDALPGSNKIKRECSAISNIDGATEINVYFTDDKLKHASENGKLKYFSHNDRERMRNDGSFPNFIRNILPGCAISYLSEKSTKNNLPIYKKTINTITWKTLIKKYNISSIEYLRIDAEGHEDVILSELFDVLKNNIITVKEIQFEYEKNNIFKINNKIKLLIKKYYNELSYKIKWSNKDNDLILWKE